MKINKTKNPRMCVVCRKREQKENLIRIVKTADGNVQDTTYKIQSRGLYICKDNKECHEKAKKRRLI
ncbi:MAG: YlxR family protein [Firmicutes bacterium]|nr:YlxR family protein [Bacillota bacterium]